MKKKSNNTPRRKRLKRSGRLEQGKIWIQTYNGKNLVKGYAKWFGVDWLCALNELKLLGILFTPSAEKQILTSYNQRIAQKRRKKSVPSDLEIAAIEFNEHMHS
jgi:hypothetical protein